MRFPVFQQQWSWRLRLLLFMTILVHVTALMGLIFMPALWLFFVALVFLNHLILATLGLMPRATWMGANLVRLPEAACARGEVALTFDDGPDPQVTPQVLDILDQYQARATFFCIGRKAAHYPELCREIVRRGHSVENHTQHHRHNFALQSHRAYLREIRMAQITLEQASGTRPCFFRAPAGFRNIFLEPVLRTLGLQLVSWSVRGFDTRVRHAERIRRKLIRGLRPGAILLLHDGNAARSTLQVPVVLEVLPSVLQAAVDAGLHCVSLRQACLPVTDPCKMHVHEEKSYAPTLDIMSAQTSVSPVTLD